MKKIDKLNYIYSEHYEIKPKSDVANIGYILKNIKTGDCGYFQSLRECERMIDAELQTGKRYLTKSGQSQ